MTIEEKRWETWNKSGVKKELEPTGYFQFLINSWTDQPCRKSWLESERRSMEDSLPEIAATMLVMGEVKAEQTSLRREEEARNTERRRQLELERQRHQLDTDRWSRFLDLAAEWRRVEIGRQFLERIKELDMPENTQVDGMALAEWVEWAEEHSHAAELIAAGPEKIFEIIACLKIAR